MSHRGILSGFAIRKSLAEQDDGFAGCVGWKQGSLWHNPGEKRARSNCRSSGDGDGRRKWMQGMDRKMWRRQKLKDLNVDLKRGRRPEGLVPGVCLGDVEMRSHWLREEMQEEE